MKQLLTLLVLLLPALPARAAETVFDFTDPADRFAASAGAGSLTYYDPAASGWGSVQTAFETAASFGIPAVPGGDKVVMAFPACTPVQAYQFTTGLAANGFFAGSGKTSDYTLVLDVLFPEPAHTSFRGLLQTNPLNTDDTDFYVRQGSLGGIGISSRYYGTTTPGVWHRVACVVRVASNTGRMEKYIDGRFVGAQGTGAAPINERWSLGPQVLLFTDDIDDTTRGYCSSVRLIDRCLKMEEIAALGGVSGGGTRVAGAPPPPAAKLPRPLRIVGHRGACGVCPENTLPSIQRGYADGSFAVEMDVRLTGDGVPVLMHDSTLDRTTDGTGAVNSHTVAQLQALDAGSWFAPEFTGTRIPTLVEALAVVPPGGIIYLDPKLTGMGPVIASALTEAGFPQERTWIYAVTITEAIALRTALPSCSITFTVGASGTPEPDAVTLAQLRALNVSMLEADAESGEVDAFLSARMREEGFPTGCFPVMGPEAMRAALASGLNMVVTDYPGVLAAMQPAPSPVPAQPDPPHQAAAVSRRILTWQPAAGATSHRIHFGTENPPPFLREQTAHIFTMPPPQEGTAYFWRIEEVTPAGLVAGPVWSFRGSTSTIAHRYEWNFAGGTLNTVRGNGTMTFRNAATQAICDYEMTDGIAVPHPGGTPAAAIRVPALTPEGGIFLTFPLSRPNGNGTFINQYALILDVLSPGANGWAALFNTSTDNSNDAEWFLDPAGRLGVGTFGYAPAGTVAQNTWYRLALSADLGIGTVKYFVNGTLVRTRTGGSQRDTRYSISTGESPGPDLLLFNEGDVGDDTHELVVANVAFADGLLLDDEIIRLGGPKASGIFGPPPPLVLSGVSTNGSQLQLTWPPEAGVRLQRSPDMFSGTWQDLPGTDAAGRYSAGITEPRQFFRLFRP